VSTELKCGFSDKPCSRCERNPSCPIYSERYVLFKQLKRLNVVLDDSLTITKAILNK